MGVRRAHGRSRRGGAGARLRRWLSLAIIAWISLVLAGREHALQAVGLHLACVHPDEVASGVVTARDDDGDAASNDRPADEDCPRDCTDCACGAVPFVPGTPPRQIAERSWSEHTFYREPVDAGPARRAQQLDRPPRRG